MFCMIWGKKCAVNQENKRGIISASLGVRSRQALYAKYGGYQLKISMVFAKTKLMLKRIVLLTVFLILLAGTCYSHTPIVQWESRSFDYQGLPFLF